ncbi:MarC family protein [Methanolacinia paynteri]|uniref:MarC family protein n=1 Tax=Methanolacinia paynteri TaxID=230356 RepID=UPI00064F4777|nr:MarC family protein [Methanolacinia paynteri]
MEELSLFVAFFGALFALANPFGNLPFFITYTEGLAPRVQKAMAILLSVFLVVFFGLFFFAGNAILQFFGISIPAFQIAGGIIVLIIALSMVSGEHTERQKKIMHVDGGADGNKSLEKDFEEAEAFLPKVLVPLGIPIYAGPGALSVVIMYGNKAFSAGWGAVIDSLIVIVVICLIVCIVNFLATPIRHGLGDQGLEILVRIMGLILAAIAVTLFIEGLAAINSTFIVPSV